MIQLPPLYTQRMQKMLGAQYVPFLSSYNLPRSYGLRCNPLKWRTGTPLPFTLSPIPWAQEGFFADQEEHPGRHPLHEAGAFYIQEPSAMSVVTLLEPHPGEIILDLCAAPGGKSTQIAGHLAGDGVLLSNEIISSRAKILSRNIERMGITNAIVCSESPAALAGQFPDTFDKILVDAPCSGEGMFRKDETAVSEWSPENTANCASRQKEILEHADKMLKNGGVLVYSTCTFSPAENEEVLLWFLRRHPEYAVQAYTNYFSPETTPCFSSGNPGFVSPEFLPLSDAEQAALASSLRLWPHKLNGEGHFAVRLQKGTQLVSEENLPACHPQNKRKFAHPSKQETAALYSLLLEVAPKNSLYPDNLDNLILFGDEIYLLPEQAPPLNQLKILRAGLHLASRKKNRLEPAHALAMSLHPDEAAQYEELDAKTATKYLHGETVPCEPKRKGWGLTGICGCSLGFGKAQNGMLKNHYPKGLRIKI